MRRELATCGFLSLLVATVFSDAGGMMLLAAALAAPVWETLFGAEQPAGSVDETNVVGWRIRYADGTIASGSDFIAWSLAPSTGIVVVNFFLGDQYDTLVAGQMARYNYVKAFADETNYWFVDGLTYGGGSTLPPGLPLGAAKVGAGEPETDFEAANRLSLYNAALADRVWNG